MRLFLLLCATVLLVAESAAASLQVFATVYGQVTNDIAVIQSAFDGSSAQKQKLARLILSRDIVLDPLLTDEQALAKLVDVLGPEGDYAPLLDESANNARAAVLSRYAALGARIDLLPPSPKATRVRARYNDLTAAVASLNNAQHAGGISTQLAPFGRQVDSVSALVVKASVMPKPRVGLNAVRASVNGESFTSSSGGAHSPNVFMVISPTQLYREVYCRVVDGARVITFTLPVVTTQARYEVSQGLATLTYTDDVFAPQPETIAATSGTFWVQSTAEEIYGIFSCSAPGLEVKEGKFRIQIPK
jgi:hypothetical protein